tara:strand:- start:79 stop:495 length:417 start_codon:yes stop_codon:yes gene_type:complete
MEEAGDQPIGSGEAPKTVVLTGTPNVGEAGQSSTGPYVQPMMMVQPSNDEATISMVMGLVTWFCHITAGLLCITACLAPVTTVVGVILGHIGLRKANEMNGLNKGMAIAGLVMNYLSIAAYIAVVAGVGLLGAGALGM